MISLDGDSYHETWASQGCMICMGNVWLAARAALTIPIPGQPDRWLSHGEETSTSLVGLKRNPHREISRRSENRWVKYDEGPFTWIQMGSNEPPDSWLDLWVGKPNQIWRGPSALETSPNTWLENGVKNDENKAKSSRIGSHALLLWQRRLLVPKLPRNKNNMEVENTKIIKIKVFKI